MKIESLQNEKVKAWCKLKEKKYRDQTSSFLIEGNHLLKEALKYGVVTEIIAQNEKYKEPQIPYYEVTSAILKKISNQLTSSDVIAVCKKKVEQEITGNVCLLDNIQDPGNLGTIIRSAVAFDIQTIILSNHSVDLYNEKVIRASEGMIFKLNILRGDLETYCQILQTKQYQIYGTDVINGFKLNEIDFPKNCAVIIGNEGQGMHQNLKKYCHQSIYIPMKNQCESLNAGVSASLIFYEIERKKAI